MRGLTLSLLLAYLPLNVLRAIEPSNVADEITAQDPQPLLNSERIRLEFGSYGIEVLENVDRLRVSNLYSLEQGKKVTRTLAVVMYPSEIPPAILAEHEVIVRGGSIGEVFKTSAWRVEKEDLYVGEIPASAGYDEIYALMGGIQPVNLAVHLYELSVCKAASCFAYATIAEVHHPGYLDLDELKKIYPAGNRKENATASQVERVLGTVKGKLLSR